MIEVSLGRDSELDDAIDGATRIESGMEGGDAARDDRPLIDDSERDDAEVDDSICAIPAAGPTTGQSCRGESAVDPRYCSEVHFCGGVFPVGPAAGPAPNVYYLPDRVLTLSQVITAVHHARVASGFIDAYEVTVGRARSWVSSGMPRPRIGEIVFGQTVWTEQFERSVLRPDRSDVPPLAFDGARDCTYTSEPGPNENRPLNCVSYPMAVAFCWWDGKHVVSDVAWEYVATAAGRFQTPFGQTASATWAAETYCAGGDVSRAGSTGRCAQGEPIPSEVGSFLAGDSIRPAGVHDLFGSLAEFAKLSDCETGCGDQREFDILDGTGHDGAVVRGTAWSDSGELLHTLIDARSYASGESPGVGTPVRWAREVVAGIRCARWDDEIARRSPP